jgi:L-gulonolactone oxidase
VARTRARSWRNWAGSQLCAPSSVRRPVEESSLVRIVEEAASRGERVKAVGSGHSFSAIALTEGCLVDLTRYAAVLASDLERGAVTVQSGIRLSRLSEELHRRGLALPNLGDIAYQSVAGAISTATHGTGVRLGNLSTLVTGLRMVSGKGELVECSVSSQPDLLRVARVGLGALGLISTVTLSCVPRFRLRAVERVERLDAVLEGLDEAVRENEHFELFWIPHTGFALTKRNNRTEAPLAPRSPLRELTQDVLVGNLVFGALCRLGRLNPSWIPRLPRWMPSTGQVDYVDRSDRVFTSPRLVRFVEMEYAIPREAAAEAVRGVRRFVEESGQLVSFPVEVRFVAADDIPLSPAYGRESAFVAVHVYRGMPYEEYFRGVERIMRDFEGRPHWGKIHFQSAETLARLYPEWDRFQEARARLDPAGRFSNSHLDRVLGPVGG